jgi:predicted metal-dependent hydrolase
LLKQDGLTGWRVNARISWYLLGKPGILRRSFLPWLAYFMPGFHPWNHDDRALIKKYESDYADAVMPAQASVPELAAAAA